VPWWKDCQRARHINIMYISDFSYPTHCAESFIVFWIRKVMTEAGFLSLFWWSLIWIKKKWQFQSVAITVGLNHYTLKVGCFILNTGAVRRRNIVWNINGSGT